MIKVFTRFWKLSNARLMAAVLSMALLSHVALAQDQQITGTVLDESGAGLPGASVLIKGTTRGTVTDMDGKYTLSAKSSDVLVISFIGYLQQELTVGTRSVVDTSLELDAAQLEDVVVTGYSVDSRRETAGAISTVNNKALTVAPSGNVEQQLQGRVAGLTVISNGQPGTTSQVRIRGFGSFLSNTPLYVVDGVSIYGGIDHLSPDDIESTTVLKDAAASSIYGSRAAAGVIVIETKKGKKGAQAMTVEYNGMYGVTTPGHGADLLSPQEHADMTWASTKNTIDNANYLTVRNGGQPTAVTYSHPQYGNGDKPVLPDYLLVGSTSGYTGSVNLADEAKNYNVTPGSPYYQVVKANKSGTDWYDAITRNAILNRHHIGIRGGGDRSSYYVGLGIQDQEGITLGQKFQRYTLRSNTQFDLNKWVRIGQNFQATLLSRRLLSGANGGAGSSSEENIILQTNRMPGIIPVYDEFGGYAGTAAAGMSNAANPVAFLDGQSRDRAFQGRAGGNVYLDIEPVKNLVFRTNLGGNYSNTNYRGYGRATYENSENNGTVGFNTGSAYFYSWQVTNTVSYKKSIGLHSFDVMVGSEALTLGVGRGINGAGINAFSPHEDYVSLNNVQSPTVNGGHGNGVTYASYFGRAKYNLDDKYFAELVVRRDGSSAFGSNNRYGVFPAFAVAWRVSEEDFMSGVSFLDDLKIRGGYGSVGNSQAVSPANQFTLFGSNIDASSYDITGSNTSAAAGYYRNTIGNPSGKWETITTTNIGLDATMFNGKIDVVLDIWKKSTTDMLFQPLLPAANGGATAPFINLAEMENKGIDLKLVNKGNITSDLKYEFTFNGGFLANKIVKLAPGQEQLDPGLRIRGLKPVLMTEGQSISAFNGLEVVGLWKDEAEIDAADKIAQDAAVAERTAAIALDNTLLPLTPTELAAIEYQKDATPGRFRFADTDGNKKVDINDNTYLGSPVPTFTGGINIKLTYKAFDFEIYGYTSIGNKIYNASRLYTDFNSLFPGSNRSTRVLDSWTPTNTSASIPVFETASNFSTSANSSSFFVENGSYFRLQNLTIGYNLPTAVLGTLKMTKLRIFGAVNNLFTVTKYKGLDPSVGGAADTNFGVDLGNYPITRSWTIGISAGF